MYFYKISITMEVYTEEMWENSHRVCPLTLKGNSANRKGDKSIPEKECENCD